MAKDKKPSIFETTAELVSNILHLIDLGEIPTAELNGIAVGRLLHDKRINRHLEYVEDNINEVAKQRYNIDLKYYDYEEG